MPLDAAWSDGETFNGAFFSSLVAQVNTNETAIGLKLQDPLTAPGDLIVRGASATVRKAVGTTGQVLRVNTGNPDKLEYAALAKTDVGLGNVDNTADASKPVSTAQAAADNAVLTVATGRAVAFGFAFG